MTSAYDFAKFALQFRLFAPHNLGCLEVDFRFEFSA